MHQDFIHQSSSDLLFISQSLSATFDIMNNPEQNQNPPAQGTRRRSSGLMPAFSGLQEHRQNPNDAARRQSMSDQQAKPGPLGMLFHKYSK
ncbi:hypothetical protein V8C44DRAFT_21894 [Trichoderma aethiopicum]